MDKASKNLDLLATFHFVVGGISAVFALFPVIHLVVGIVILTAPNKFTDGGGEAPPEFFGWIFVAMAGTAIFVGLTLAGILLVAGLNLRHRRRHLFCQIAAGISCIMFPFGTVLGVFTLIQLAQDETKALFSS